MSGRIVLYCAICKTAFSVYPYRIALGNARCCSKKCSNIERAILAKQRRERGFAEAFWTKVKRTDSCWIWTAFIDTKGYGGFGVNGRMRGAHRVAWQLVHGPIPDGLCVLHRCDNPPCVNPEHLFLGTQLDNIADMNAKGRNGASRGAKRAPL